MAANCILFKQISFKMFSYSDKRCKIIVLKCEGAEKKGTKINTPLLLRARAF